MKIGVLEEGFSNCEADVSELVRTCVQSLKSVGATVEDMSVPLHTKGKIKTVTVNSPLMLFIAKVQF